MKTAYVQPVIIPVRTAADMFTKTWGTDAFTVKNSANINLTKTVAARYVNISVNIIAVLPTALAITADINAYTVPIII